MVALPEKLKSLDAQIGSNVERLRKERSWSQSELARRMKETGFERFNQMAVSRIENGERGATARELMGFAEVFDVEMYFLLDNQPAQNVAECRDQLESARENLRAALQQFDHARERLAFAAENADMNNRRMPPYAATVLSDLEETAKDFVDYYTAERMVGRRYEGEVAAEYMRQKGQDPEDMQHGIVPESGTYPFVEALMKADDGVDPEAS